MHIISKFQFFIHNFTAVKLKNENQNWKKTGQRRRVFSDFFKVTNLNELISYKLHIYVKVMLTILSITYLKMVWLLKHLMRQNMKRVGSTFQHWKLGSTKSIIPWFYLVGCPFVTELDEEQVTQVNMERGPDFDVSSFRFDWNHLIVSVLDHGDVARIRRQHRFLTHHLFLSKT